MKAKGLLNKQSKRWRLESLYENDGLLEIEDSKRIVAVVKQHTAHVTVLPLTCIERRALLISDTPISLPC